MKEDMDQWAGDLVPLTKEEMELFSLGQEKQVLRRGMSVTAKGIFTTIYHERVLAYSYRRYLGKDDKPNALLLARTAAHEYRYWIRKGLGTLYIDGQEVGELDRQGALRGKRTGKTLAAVQRDASKLLPVSVGGREVGSLSASVKDQTKGLYDRAFEFLRDDMDDKEEQLFLALALKELVERTVEKGK
ncbi:MAG: hypothetical protein KDC54_01005 [Lewinella sp.]|nr:hypothetical protein [Lewinella sp.]